MTPPSTPAGSLVDVILAAAGGDDQARQRWAEAKRLEVRARQRLEAEVAAQRAHQAYDAWIGRHLPVDEPLDWFAFGSAHPQPLRDERGQATHPAGAVARLDETLFLLYTDSGSGEWTLELVSPCPCGGYRHADACGLDLLARALQTARSANPVGHAHCVAHLHLDAEGNRGQVPLPHPVAQTPVSARTAGGAL